jgi:hypothetical protein
VSPLQQRWQQQQLTLTNSYYRKMLAMHA